MAGSIRVISKRAGGVPAAPGEWIVDGDRKSQVLGNRHVLLNHRDPVERDRVIQNHLIEDLEPDILRGGPIYLELQRVAERVQAGQPVAFACWCAPMPCHCDHYVEVVKMMVSGLDVQALYQSRMESRQAVAPAAIERDQFDFGF